MPPAFADRLLDAVRRKGNSAVVALDPVFSNLPDSLRKKDELDAISSFSRDVLRTIAPIVPVVKINSAYFERYRHHGLAAYFELIAEASRLGLIVIGDVKRGDVGHTAEQYAAAHLDGTVTQTPNLPAPDAITLNGYFGMDGIAPFVDICRTQGRGIFILVRTSNPSASAIQDLPMADGRKVHELMATEVARWAAASETTGAGGYSSVGAVVATRSSQDAARLRSLMPHSWLLVPGYGAQGGSAEDFAPYFKPDGSGALVAAGRSVIFAFQTSQYRDIPTSNWLSCVEQACKAFVADLRRVATVR